MDFGEQIVADYGAGKISASVAVRALICIRMGELLGLSDNLFDLSGWLEILTPEQRNALEA
jgi:hypothetical protein